MSAARGLVREPLAIALREAKAPLVLSVDVGTSGLRAFLFDARARPIGSCVAHADLRPRTSRDGGVTVDAEEHFRTLASAIDRVLLAAGRRAGQIAAVACSSFWHSLVGIDERGRPTTRVLTWADTRARDAAATLRTELDEPTVHRRTGCRLHASYLPAKLRYLRATDPEVYGHTEWWGSFPEYVAFRLFGERRVGHGMASATGLYDQRARRWDTPLLAHIELDPAALSPIDDAAQVGLRAPYARRWPVLARVPWLPAFGDGACSNVGAGAVARDLAALMLATSGALRVLYASDEPPVVAGGWTYRLDARRFVAGGALSNGGNVLWWLRDVFPQVDQARVARRLGSDHGLIALPLLAGDRSPTWDDGARAAIAGIGLGTSADDVVLAMLEGLVHRVARLWDLVEAALPGIRTVVATGGVALRSPWLVQLVADAIGRPVVASGAGEGSARGAALAALERIGAIPDLGAVPSPLGRTFRPREEVRERLRAGMERQRRLEAALSQEAELRP